MIPASLCRFLSLAAVLAAVPGAPALAQQGDGVSRNLTLLGIPSATVAPRGLGFAALSLSDRRIGPGPRQDGSLAFGLGFGSAEDAVGVQVTSYITSLTDSFADSGYFEVKASRRIVGGQTPTYASLAFSGGGFGDARGRDATATVALTSFRQMQFAANGPSYPVMFTLGAGTHVRNAERDPGVFGGVGIGLTQSLGASVAWSGEFVNIGAALRFDAVPNFSVSATLFDAFDQKNSRRIGVSFIYVLNDLF